MRSKELTWHYGDVITTLQQEIPYHTQWIQDFNHVSFHYHDVMVKKRIVRKCHSYPLWRYPGFCIQTWHQGGNWTANRQKRSLAKS